MKKSKFTETQIVSILKQADAGVPIKDICRQADISVPLALAHWIKASPRNSGPLSERSTCCNPWSRLICSKTRTSRAEVIDVSTSMCSASRLKSSTTLNVQKRRPQASASLMKSINHTVSGSRGTYSATRSRLGRRRRAVRRRLSFIALYTR